MLWVAARTGQKPGGGGGGAPPDGGGGGVVVEPPGGGVPGAPDWYGSVELDGADVVGTATVEVPFPSSFMIVPAAIASVPISMNQNPIPLSTPSGPAAMKLITMPAAAMPQVALIWSGVNVSTRSGRATLANPSPTTTSRARASSAGIAAEKPLKSVFQALNDSSPASRKARNEKISVISAPAAATRSATEMVGLAEELVAPVA